ncbi:hypothetical protein C2857_003953 [Epichloe festucae Fl1]|uniref:Uncharacterized protein n=1 Tax=Epichloe festucae (strain Fl1) TaxID=877507 RepID=A0A7U3Q3C8_EPIFF|nr:hypothetical protein C2857_003953 [Epichloe festucae Fl1]
MSGYTCCKFQIYFKGAYTRFTSSFILDSQINMKLLAFLASTAVAFLPPLVIAKCEMRCINAISPCGVPYGGCFNPCTEAAPVPPPCDGVIIAGLPTQGKQPMNAMLDDCRTRTVCVDAVNECGIRYGGCIPDCRPWKLSKPPCPTATSNGGTAFRESRVPRAVAYQTPS